MFCIGPHPIYEADGVCLCFYQAYGIERYVDDTFTIIKKNNRNSFLQHLNSIHPNIKFTCEEVRSDGSMPFLDILIAPEEDDSLTTSVFRKPTHTDLYLQWDSHHTIPSKYSVSQSKNSML